MNKRELSKRAEKEILELQKQVVFPWNYTYSDYKDSFIFDISKEGTTMNIEELKDFFIKSVNESEMDDTMKSEHIESLTDERLKQIMEFISVRKLLNKIEKEIL
jgi:hypothetical protein